MAQKLHFTEHMQREIESRLFDEPLLQPQGITTVPLIRPPENCENRKPHPFPYTPLPMPTSVRLLRIEQLECRSEIAALRRLIVHLGCPVAVYCKASDISSAAAWAAPAFDITCNGRPYSVTTNLYTALLSLRVQAGPPNTPQDRSPVFADGLDHYTLSSLIWIDQICINQDDLEERAAQVQLMGQIYTHAERVIGWLGGEDVSRSGADFLVRVLDITGEKTKILFTLGNFLNRFAYQTANVRRIGPRQWVAAYAFLHRTWFERTWVIQEFVIAKKLAFVCGLQLFPVDLVATALELLASSNALDLMTELAVTFHGRTTRLSPDVKALQEACHEKILFHHPGRDSWKCRRFISMIVRLRVTQFGHYHPTCSVRLLTEKMECGLLDILSMFRETLATDPRDKVYGFLGLLDKLQHRAAQSDSLLAVDYRHPVHEIYTGVMRYLLSSVEGLNCLRLREGRAKTTIPNLPSWVPDLTIANTPIPLRLYQGSTPWSAGGSLPSCVVEFLEDSYVETAGLPLNADRREVVRVDGEGTVVQQSRMEVFWRTIITDTFGSEYPSALNNVDIFMDMWDRSLHGLMMNARLIAELKLGKFLRDSAFDPKTYDWEGLKLLISRMYKTQPSILEDQGDSIKDKAFPPELDRILPQLEVAWTQGKLCDAGVGLAMRCLKKASGRDSNATLGLYLSDPGRARGEKSLHMDLIKDRLVRSTTGKVVFATNEGQLGLGNDHIKLGDEAWIFPGTETPFILRPTKEGEFELLGEAYVHGSMHGEVGSGLSMSDLSISFLV